MRAQPTYYEFFAGGGMARAGLGSGWRCLFANDFDAKKAASYKANWGDAEFRLADVHTLGADDLPGHADLAWASFPCQDLSLAGNGAGLKGARSGAFWGFWSVIHGLRAQRRAPKILVLENVAGALTSNGGADFAELCKALLPLDYLIGALTIDAAYFVPQSRARLFIVAVRKDVHVDAMLASASPSPRWTSAALMRAHSALEPRVRRSWEWWTLPAPVSASARLSDIIEDAPPDVPWHTRAETARLVAMMSEANCAKLRAAQAAGGRVAGTVYRRTRHDSAGAKIQRAEVRFDGVSGCLRTPGGGSSRQFVIIVEGQSVRSRLLSGREAARLMGLPDSYILPERYNDAYHLVGDGLVVPVVRFLAENLLAPIAVAVPPFRLAAE